MNSTQIQTTLAPLLTFLAGLAAGKGLFGWDAITWYTILGGLVGFGATIWAAVTTRNTAVIAQVASLPEVRGVVTTVEVAKSAAFATNNTVVSQPSEVPTFATPKVA
jgi:hypothetical protein